MGLKCFRVAYCFQNQFFFLITDPLPRKKHRHCQVPETHSHLRETASSQPVPALCYTQCCKNANSKGTWPPEPSPSCSAPRPRDCPWPMECEPAGAGATPTLPACPPAAASLTTCLPDYLDLKENCQSPALKTTYSGICGMQPGLTSEIHPEAHSRWPSASGPRLNTSGK